MNKQSAFEAILTCLENDDIDSMATVIEEADGTFVEVHGTVRYRILMNFSNLSFFIRLYRKKFGCTPTER